MEIDKTSFVFQTDSRIVKAALIQDNYLIEYNEKCPNRNTCAIYFSSNDIYFPNTEAVFRKRIVERNFYEWYNSRIEKAYKHIFIRDICKQWYLGGINSRIDTPEKLLELLKEQTEGYSVVTLGSSAGGYAAVLYGSLLGGSRILSFNGQFELDSLLITSTGIVNPLLFKYKDTDRRLYYDIKKYINQDSEIFYFHSAKSAWDIAQHRHVADVVSIHFITFQTKHHGIPFPKNCLQKVINYDLEKLQRLSMNRHTPLFFSIQVDGVVKTLVGLYKQLRAKYKARR